MTDPLYFDRRAMLRVKINSLAAEARIIRAAERKAKGALREELHSHRQVQVRMAARHTTLALGLIKGRSWHEMEGKCHLLPNWGEVAKMVAKYGPKGAVLPDVSATFEDRRLQVPPRPPYVPAAQRVSEAAQAAFGE